MPTLRPDDARAAGVQSFVDVLEFRAAALPDRVIFRQWHGDGERVTPLTYAALRARARAIGAALQERAEPGDRVLLLVAPGLDYIAAFFGCLYAGAIAVPAYPPHPRRRDARLTGVIADCGARVAVSTPEVRARAERAGPDRRAVAALDWVDLAAATPAVPQMVSATAGRDTIALLQYTSGSTGTPRGVTITHGNLLANAAAIHAVAAHEPGDEAVFWLPPFHDMGLIGGVLQPVYADVPTTVMAPATFLQRPARWLHAMTRFGATTTGAPNFAYDLCVDRIPAAERTAFALSRWRTAFNGAEPVRATTLARFVRAFAGAGLRADVFVSCYGLAEATLLVAARRIVAPPPRGPVPVGDPVPGVSVTVVDPASGEPLRQGEVGELVVVGGGVAVGYWGVSAAEEFAVGPDGRRVLRTGDLGFRGANGLVITGRRRELVIVGGRNHHPHDLEETVERAHPILRRNGTVVFAVDTPRGEMAVVVAEVRRGRTGAADATVHRAIRDALGRDHGVLPGAIVLVPPGTVPRTSSGKRQRAATRALFEAGALPALSRTGDSAAARDPRSDVAAVIGRWVQSELGIAAEAVTDATDLQQLGLDSVGATHLMLELEAATGRTLDPSIVWAQRTVGELAAYVRTAPAAASGVAASDGARVADWPEVRAFAAQRAALTAAAGGVPFGQVFDGVAGRTLQYEGGDVLNFASYNYLGLNGEPRVVAAAQRALARWGTSSSASRLVSGERPIHGELERALAEFIGVEAALVFVGGHATNTSAIPMLVGRGDVVLCDEAAHNSAVLGALQSGARRVAVAHNDLGALAAALERERPRARRALILVEGLYSADGDRPDLAGLVALKARHDALLMVDEAHSLGVLGATGRGIAEACGVAPSSVDVWMGTLSKSLASCGGYIAGNAALVEYLRWNTPGFVFSVGIPPAQAAAALEALAVLREQPERVAQVAANTSAFVAACRAEGVPVCGGDDGPIVLVPVGDTATAVAASRWLLAHGVSVAPLVPPAVPEGAARLRFFITSLHRPEDLTRAAATVAAGLAAVAPRVPVPA